MNSHQCIKSGCGNTYQDNDVDPYYCPSCLSEKQQVAKKLDKQFNTVGQTPSGALAAYDALRGSSHFPSAGKLGFEGFK